MEFVFALNSRRVPRRFRASHKFTPVCLLCSLPPQGAYDLPGALSFSQFDLRVDHSFLVPIWGCGPRDKDGVQLGTAVLLHHAGNYLLLTAEHVMRKGIDRGLAVPCNAGHFVDVEGELFQIREVHDPHGDFIFDADIGGVFLSESFAEQMVPRFGFFPHEGLEMTGRSLDGFECTIGGFPSRGQRIGPREATNTYLSMETTHGSAEELAKLGCRSHLQAAVHFRRKRSWDLQEGRFLEVCHPDGMSGGALVTFVPDAQDPDQLTGNLSAILTDYDAHNHFCVGTRISFILDQLRFRYPQRFK